MTIQFMSAAFSDFCAWMEENRKIGIKIKQLIKEIEKTPFNGTGKPEPLKYDRSGCFRSDGASDKPRENKLE